MPQTDGRTVGRLMTQVHRAAMRTLDRHVPCDPVLAAIVMEAYEEYLGGEFREQMSMKYGVEYPLNLKIKMKEENG